MGLTWLKHVEEPEAQVTPINSPCYSAARMRRIKITVEVKAWQ